MIRLFPGRLPAATAISMMVLGLAAQAAEPRSNAASLRGVVELETGSANGISVRVAEDLANIVDDGATRRVLPVVGKGSLQNVTDLRLLRGVDMAILQQDVLDYARKQRRDLGLENAVTYIAKLYNEEFHLLARRDIASVVDLSRQKVNVDLRGAGTAITAIRVFDLLHIPIVMTNDDQREALEKLRTGEIAALAYVAGKPAPLFRDLRPEDGFHFLPVPLDLRMARGYSPAKLTAQDYPAVVAPNDVIETVAVPAVLVVANMPPESERYNNVANFVDTFFTQFQLLLQPSRHPKWAEVNLNSELPGWRRFGPAEQWLERNGADQPAADARPDKNLQPAFERFLEQRLQFSRTQGMTQQQKDDLFGQFERWKASQAH